MNQTDDKCHNLITHNDIANMINELHSLRAELALTREERGAARMAADQLKAQVERLQKRIDETTMLVSVEDEGEPYCDEFGPYFVLYKGEHLLREDYRYEGGSWRDKDAEVDYYVKMDSVLWNNLLGARKPEASDA